jgi:hypothetical protein
MHQVSLTTGKDFFRDRQGLWELYYTLCPACQNSTVWLQRKNSGNHPVGDPRMVWPKGIARAPLPPEVLERHAADYREACLVLSDSPKASAALSRRCLQGLLRETASTKSRDLADQIREVIPTLPSYLAGAVDAIRVIGNFAAHPTKSTNAGEIVDVEPEGLFDFYFVQPAKLAARRAALDKKAGGREETANHETVMAEARTPA